MINAPADWRLYLVTDSSMVGERDVADVVEQAVIGGVTVVQLREKTLGTYPFIELARRVKARLEPYGVPLIINDRIDVALAAQADGVHVGQSDVSCLEARDMLGADALVGLSVETLEQARAAEAWEVDYYGVSPIFSTPTKEDTGAPWGVEGLRTLRRETGRVLVAIGGLKAGNAGEVMGAGADGIAVVSAICAADDPAEAARELRRAIHAG